jgi:hypothetical protein
MRMGEIAEMMGLRFWQADRAVRRMEEKGHAERVGGGKFSGCYIAAGKEPQDMRGTSVNSLTALRAGWQRVVVKQERVTTPVVLSVLAQALMWQPLDCSRVDEGGDMGFNVGGNVRPEKAAA